MNMLRCDECDRPFDTDVIEMETFPCGEDDHFVACPTCAKRINTERDAEMMASKRAYNAASPAERNPAQYRADLTAAGRGHLLPDDWEQPV